MNKKEFLQHPLQNAKDLNGLEHWSIRCKRLIEFVRQSDIPDEAVIDVIEKSDWYWMERRPHNNHKLHTRSFYTYDWKIIGCSQHKDIGYYVYAIAWMPNVPEYIRYRSVPKNTKTNVEVS